MMFIEAFDFLFRLVGVLQTIMGDMMLGEVNIPQLNIVNAVLDVTVRKLELFNSKFVKNDQNHQIYGPNPPPLLTGPVVVVMVVGGGGGWRR